MKAVKEEGNNETKHLIKKETEKNKERKVWSSNEQGKKGLQL